MMRLGKIKNGFSTVEVILAGASVIVILFVGLMVYGHYNKSDAALVLQRQQYIDKTISHLSLQNYTNFATSLNEQGYLTPSLYSTTQSLVNAYAGGNFSSSPAYGKLICVNQVPSTYTYGAVNLNSDDDTASLPVKVFAAGSAAPTSYTAYWVKTNGTWQLNNAGCSLRTPVGI